MYKYLKEKSRIGLKYMLLPYYGLYIIPYGIGAYLT